MKSARRAGRCPPHGSAGACTAGRSRRPRRDPRRVEVDRGPAVGRLDALSVLDLVDDRLRDRIARPERVGELLAVGVQEHGAVRARRLRDRVALHVRRPGAAVRVVLQRVEVARLRAEVDRDLRHLAGGAGMVGRQLAALLRHAVAAAAGGEDDRRRRRARARRTRARQPFSIGSSALSGDFGKVTTLLASAASRSAFVIAWPVRSPTWSSRWRVAPPQRASR